MRQLHTRIIYTKFGWNGPSGSGEHDFFVNNYIIISLFFLYYFPLLTPNPLQLHPISCSAKKPIPTTEWEIHVILIMKCWHEQCSHKYPAHVNLADKSGILSLIHPYISGRLNFLLCVLSSQTLTKGTAQYYGYCISRVDQLSHNCTKSGITDTCTMHWHAVKSE